MTEDGKKKTSSGVTLSGASLLFLVGFSIVAAFLVGSLWTKVRLIEKDNDNGNPTLGMQDTAQNAEDQQFPPPTITDDDHIRGNKQARIAMVEYSDYDCPFCARFHDTAKQILDTYPDDVMWVYKHFPLPSLHPDAEKKSQAAECVTALGGEDVFWAFSDSLYLQNYENATAQEAAVSLEEFSAYAQNLGIDLDAYNECLNGGEFEQKVLEQQSEGVALGVEGTPSIILYDTKTEDASAFPGAFPFETLKEAIDGMLAN